MTSMMKWLVKLSPLCERVEIETGQTKNIPLGPGNEVACVVCAPKACPKKLAILFDPVVEIRFKGKKVSSFAVLGWRGGSLLVKRRGLQFRIDVESLKIGGVCSVCREALQNEGTTWSCYNCGSSIHMNCISDSEFCPICFSRKMEVSNV